MRDVERRWRQERADHLLDQVNGIARWTEWVVGGDEAVMSVNGRHLNTVLLARPAYLERHGLTPLALPNVRTTYPKKTTKTKRKAAPAALRVVA